MLKWTFLSFVNRQLLWWRHVNLRCTQKVECKLEFIINITVQYKKFVIYFKMGFHLSGPITAISLENLKLETELRRPGPERLPARQILWDLDLGGTRQLLPSKTGPLLTQNLFLIKIWVRNRTIRSGIHLSSYLVRSQVSPLANKYLKFRIAIYAGRILSCITRALICLRDTHWYGSESFNSIKLCFN